MFPSVRDSHRSANVSSILNPSLPMKPVQNLDQINPFTGLPNIEFIPTTEYLNGVPGSSYLPDWTPSPDTTSRRVAAILEPHHTYSQLVHDLNTQKQDQQRLEMLEQQMRNFSFQQATPALPDYQYVPVSTQTQAGYSYLQPHGVDPTFLGNRNLQTSNINTYQHAYSSHQPLAYTNTNYGPPIYTTSLTQPVPTTHSVTSLNNLQFDQQQLDQAWAQLSSELGRSRQPTAKYQGPRSGQQPLQGVLDMISIDRISNLSRPLNNSRSTLNNFYKASDERQRKLESTYEDLLSLPKMAESPSELDPPPSSEDELSRYNERRRQNIFTLMNRGRDGNVDLKKHQLSQKYQEAKYVENRILGHVPSVLQDLQKLDLNKKMNEKNKEIDKTLRQISKSYEGRCKQREKMKSALSLVKEIPKMEFDQYNNLIAKEDTTLLSNIKKSKNSNTIKMDDMEFEVSDEIMSMIYHRALKKRLESKSSKQKTQERRRSRTKLEDRSKDSSSEAEIAEIMSNDIFKRKVAEFDRNMDRQSQVKCLQRYSPRHLSPLLPVMEDKCPEVVREEAEEKTEDRNFQLTRGNSKMPLADLKELKFLISEDPVPSPAPLEKNTERKSEGIRENVRIVKKSEQTFVKSKSSSEFKSLPRARSNQRRGSIDRGKDEGDLQEMKRSSINISKTAKKHLGMAVTPVVKESCIEEMFQTIGNSYESGSTSDRERKMNCGGKDHEKKTSPMKENPIDLSEPTKHQDNTNDCEIEQKIEAEKLGSNILYCLE